MARKVPFLIDLLAGFLVGLILSVVIALFLFKKARRVLRFTSILPKWSLFNLFSIRKSQSLPRKPPVELLFSKARSKAWVYKLRNQIYDPSDFSFSTARLCLIELRGNILLISHPRREPDHKLTDDELDSYVDFHRIDTYDLDRVTISLSPKQISRSNYWSKTSPIVLNYVLCLNSELIGNPLSPVLEPSEDAQLAGDRTTLIFFPRTRRSKEDWFYRFDHASQLDRWRNDIQHRLPKENSSQGSPQQSMKESTQGTKEFSTDADEEENRTRLAKFLEHHDRFSSPDQFPDLTSIDILQPELGDAKKPKIERASQRRPHQRSNNEQTIADVQQPRTDPRQSKGRYCARWIIDQQQIKRLPTDADQPVELQMDGKGKCEVTIDLNDIVLGSARLPRVYFVLNYLHQLPDAPVQMNHSSPLLLINIFAARCFLDLFDNENCLDRIRTFAQKQLGKMHVPFIEHLTITDLNLGDRLPQIQDMYKPWIDEHGLWASMQISFDGRLQSTLTARIRWRRKHRTSGQTHHPSTPFSDRTESEPHAAKQSIDRSAKMPWRQRLWTPKRWFRHHKPNSKIRLSKKIDGIPRLTKHPLSETEKTRSKISKTTIVIKLEVNRVTGVLLFNVPPLPSDRIWMSFLQMPEMTFSVM